jgi:hypothetical protein
MVTPTSIHLPKSLLDEIERRAHALHVSRSGWIRLALERELRVGGGWSPEFFDRLSSVDPETSEAVDELLAAARSARSLKAAPRLWAAPATTSRPRSR